MEREDEALWEQVKMAMLRDIVDDTARKLREGDLTTQETRVLMESTRHKVLALFPDKGGVYDLIYVPRFQRIIKETNR